MTHLPAIEHTLLGWTPFINPINAFHQWWYLLMIPLAFGIAIIYKAVRMPDLQRFWRESLAMTAQIVLAMLGLAIVIMLLVQVAIPLLPVE